MNIPNPKLLVGLVYDKIYNLKPKLASGPDGLPNYFLINCACTVSYFSKMSEYGNISSLMEA